VGLLLFPLGALAQVYPHKPIRMIVAFPAGGVADLLARAVAQRLTERMGQQVVVDNRAGAGGVIGTDMAAKAAADGHTLLYASSSTLATGPAMQRDLPYDPIRDFAPITLTTLIPNMLVAHASVPVRSVKELIDYAKARPGQLSYASNGTGTVSHFAGELFRRAAGIEWIHVPYKGAGIAINDALGGHVQFLIGSTSTSLPHVRAGRLRALAVTSSKRSAGIPEVPTIAESGFPGFEVIQWSGLVAPAQTPAAIVHKINAEVAAFFAQPEVADRFTRLGLDSSTDTPQEFGRFIRAELARWTKAVNETGIRDSI
jgi:tripartite-type tricarboxylate transporter receptor subunit TctC